MGEQLQSGKGIFIVEIQQPCMGLDDLKIEGNHLIEEGLSGSKPGSLMWLIA
jgi:hypothetical protein